LLLDVFLLIDIVTHLHIFKGLPRESWRSRWWAKQEKWRRDGST